MIQIFVSHRFSSSRKESIARFFLLAAVTAGFGALASSSSNMDFGFDEVEAVGGLYHATGQHIIALEQRMEVVCA